MLGSGLLEYSDGAKDKYLKDKDKAVSDAVYGNDTRRTGGLDEGRGRVLQSLLD